MFAQRLMCTLLIIKGFFEWQISREAKQNNNDREWNYYKRKGLGHLMMGLAGIPLFIVSHTHIQILLLLIVIAGCIVAVKGLEYR